MKTLPPWSIRVGALALTLGLGIFIGRTGAGPAPAENDDSAANPSRDRAGSAAATFRADGGPGNARTAGMDIEGDPLGTLRGILEGTGRLGHTQRLLAYLDRLPDDRFASVYEELKDSPMADIRNSERSLILQAWAERDPLAATGHLQENGADDWERETVLGSWATVDPQGAFAWAMNAEDVGRINNWVVGAMEGVASSNPELARDFLMEIGENETRERSLRSIDEYVTQFGYDYAEAWISQITDDGLMNRAAQYLADEMAELDPAKAAVWNTSIADTGTRRDVSETVSDRWARQDLDSARKWVESLPADTMTEAAEGVARHYARQDPLGAAEWLQGLGDDPDLDGARHTLIRESMREQPELALNFVGTLSDQGDRNRHYGRYLGWWMRRDEEAARSWAADNAGVLPEQLVERLNR